MVHRANKSLDVVEHICVPSAGMNVPVLVVELS